MMNDTITKRKCPSCGKPKILSDENTGELFCGSCGFVITDKIEDTGAEWRSFSQDEGNRARTGAGTSITMHDMGLSTVIGSVNKDATGKPLSASMRSSIERLRTWDSRTQAHSSSDRNLRQALSEMDKIKDKLALTNAVIEKAAYIYRKAIPEKIAVSDLTIPATPEEGLYLLTNILGLNAGLGTVIVLFISISLILFFKLARIHKIARYFIFTLSVMVLIVALIGRFTDFVPTNFQILMYAFYQFGITVGIFLVTRRKETDLQNFLS